MSRLFVWEREDLKQNILHLNNDECFLFNYQHDKFNDFEILDEEELGLDDWPEAKPVKNFGTDNHEIVKFILDGQHLDY